MTMIAAWEPIYLIQQNVQTTNLLEYPRFRKGSSGLFCDTGIQGLSDQVVLTDVGKFLLPVTNSAIYFKPIPEAQEIEKSTGASKQDVVEFNTDETVPTRVTISFVANAYTLSLFLWLLFQNGASESIGASATTATFIPYTSSDCEAYVSLVKVLVDKSTSRKNDTTSHILLGCVCEELTISGSTGGLLTVDATLVGADWQKYNVIGEISNNPRLQHYPMNTQSAIVVKHDGIAFTGTVTEKDAQGDFTAEDKMLAGNVEWSYTDGYLNFASADLISYAGQEISLSIDTQDSQLWSALQEYPTLTPFKWEQCGITVDGSTAWLNEFSLTLTNDVMPKFYDKQAASSFLLGRLRGEGTISIPWSSPSGSGNAQLDDFLSDTNKTMVLTWGGFSGINDALTITLKYKYSNIIISEDPEFESVCTFKLADDSTTNCINIACTYDSNKLIRNIT